MDGGGGQRRSPDPRSCAIASLSGTFASPQVLPSPAQVQTREAAQIGGGFRKRPGHARSAGVGVPGSQQCWLVLAGGYAAPQSDMVVDDAGTARRPGTGAPLALPLPPRRLFDRRSPPPLHHHRPPAIPPPPAAASAADAAEYDEPAADDDPPRLLETPEELQYHRLIDDYLSTTPPPGPQDQLERLAADACSVAREWDHQSAAERATTSPTTPTARRPPPPDVHRPLPITSPPAMASNGAIAAASSRGRGIPRTSSIDSAISNVSTASHTHSSSSASNSVMTAGAAASPVEIQNLIAAAGNAETLIAYMLKDKNSLTAQNSQLWRLVDKQRAMILGLNKDLERALRDKERYRKKLKEHLNMVPPLPSGVSTATQATITPSRAMTESPALSMDEIEAASKDSDSLRRSESVPLSERRRQDSTASSDVTSPVVSAVSEPHYITSSRQRAPPPDDAPSAEESLVLLADKSLLHTPTEISDGNPSPRSVHVEEEQPEAEAETQPNTATLIAPTVPIMAPLSPININAAPMPPPQSPPQHEMRRLGLSTAVQPVTGLGKSPMRKAPPAPLSLAHQPETVHEDEEELDDAVSIHEIEGYEREHSAQRTAATDRSWEATPEDKKGMGIATPGPATGSALAPPARAAPVPQAGAAESRAGAGAGRPMGVGGLGLDPLASPRLKQQFARAPLASPGLPSSPRPIDRPANSPMPRGSRVTSPEPPRSPRAAGLAAAPRMGLQPIPPFVPPGTPRTAAPPASAGFVMPSAGLPSPSPYGSAGFERSMSSGSGSSNMPLLRHQKSASSDSPSPRLLIQPSAVASIDSRVVSSRLRPSRASMLPGKVRSINDESVFTLGVFSRTSGKEILRVEKDSGSLPALDSRLRKHISYTVRPPDRSLFSGHAPARIDARRAAIDEYLAGVLGATMDESAALALCAFFSTDVVENNITTGDFNSPSPTGSKSTPTKAIKEGFLTKRGKNFGGWKERYFVLDGPVLKYFDMPQGNHLGQIKLQHAQIGRQSAQKTHEDDQDPESQYRHAFLILEPKRKDSSTLVRHVLCAENDNERDEWVEALLQYVEHGDGSEDKADRPNNKLKKSREVGGSGSSKHSKESKDHDDIRTVSYDEAPAGPAPSIGAMGVEEINRQHISPSPSNSTLSVAPSQSSGLASPHPDRSHSGKSQISAPTNGVVISDLSAWGSKLMAPPTEKAAKKRSIWGFRQRSSSDLDEKDKAQAALHQNPGERYTLSRAVFGASLEEAVHMTKPAGVDVSLPSVVYRCIEYLDAKMAWKEEGIFRLSGSNTVIKGLKERFNTGLCSPSFHYRANSSRIGLQPTQ